MNEMKEAVGNWREAKQFSPADENDFLRWLDKADTEEKLFSRLTFWFTFRGLPADQNQRYHLVQERARELRLWNGLELKLRRWQDRVADEYEQIGKEAFAARIGEDYADYINSLTDPEAAPEAAPEPETAKPAGVQAWSARELSEMVLPPIRHVVEGLLPMGMGVLVAKPKLGKSWMVLDLCLAVAQGEPFLGFPTRQHGTLYLALEDGKSRMQTRLRRLLEGRPAPANMHVMFQAQRLGEGLLETLGEYLDANPDIHLVCIDTLSKIKPKAKPFENAYDADYDYMGRLKAFADSRGICVLLVHHTRKSKNPEDSFDNINGSTGILGAADFTIVLDKQSRMDDEAGFLLTGRDIEQCERVIRFDKARCRWVMQGTAAQLAAQRRVAEYEAEPIVKTLRVLLQQGFERLRTVFLAYSHINSLGFQCLAAKLRGLRAGIGHQKLDLIHPKIPPLACSAQRTAVFAAPGAVIRICGCLPLSTLRILPYFTISCKQNRTFFFFKNPRLFVIIDRFRMISCPLPCPCCDVVRFSFCFSFPVLLFS